MTTLSARPAGRLVVALVGGLTFLASAAAVRADFGVPNAYATTMASSSGINALIRDNGVALTYQMLIHANELGAIPLGSPIHGISFRMWAGSGATSFPATAATWSSYTITLGPGVALGSATATFASNFSGPTTVVRSGPLTIPAQTFPGGQPFPSPNAFGWIIPFTTPYVYNGGNLVIEVRHTGSNIVNGSNDSLEAVVGSDPNYNIRFSAIAAAGDTATSGTFTSFTTLLIVTEPLPVELLSIEVE